MNTEIPQLSDDLKFESDQLRPNDDCPHPDTGQFPPVESIWMMRDHRKVGVFRCLENIFYKEKMFNFLQIPVIGCQIAFLSHI